MLCKSSTSTHTHRSHATPPPSVSPMWSTRVGIRFCSAVCVWVFAGAAGLRFAVLIKYLTTHVLMCARARPCLANVGLLIYANVCVPSAYIYWMGRIRMRMFLCCSDMRREKNTTVRQSTHKHCGKYAFFDIYTFDDILQRHHIFLTLRFYALEMYIHLFAIRFN